MKIKWFVFSEKGPYNWERHEESIGHYYDRSTLFDTDGYNTEEDAIKAVENYVGYETFFILKGYIVSKWN